MNCRSFFLEYWKEILEECQKEFLDKAQIKKSAGDTSERIARGILADIPQKLKKSQEKK